MVAHEIVAYALDMHEQGTPYQPASLQSTHVIEFLTSTGLIYRSSKLNLISLHNNCLIDKCALRYIVPF